MEHLTFAEMEPYFESLPGLMIIDLQGKTLYMNQQCAEYFGIDRDETIGKDIREYFPETTMLDDPDIDKPRVVFYNSYLGIGISVNFPVYDENGTRIGIGEFDVVQNSEFLYGLADDYRGFLDRVLNEQTGQLSTFGRTRYTINDIQGKSQLLQSLRAKIISTATTNSTVMIIGETGTGKELVAHAIHNLSNRRKERFVKINAASLPESLFEAELFGYEKGSFTGALSKGKEGKFELANKGTLFIDEINQMPMSVQPKLLRALQEKEIDRIGGAEPIPVDVRIITASNEDLEKLVRQGKFREDLYYRLNVIEIKTPPLREHPEDVEEIVQSMIEELNVENRMSILGVDEAALEDLKSRYWKGNIRELRNVIESAMVFAKGDMLHAEDLDPAGAGGRIDIDALQAKGNILDQARDEAEREVLLRVLHRFDNNKSKTARYLGIARPVLYQKLKRLGIDS
ncbi:MAG: sigma 54-interacting transcriptional regulator [Firmicutes bacterium]|nr:sigma 54-interacting transcriptional regulator [Bacillota bacterium]